MKRLLTYLTAAVSGAALALALPLVVPFVSLRAAPSLRAALLRGLVAGLAYCYCAIYWVSHAMTEFGGLSVGLSFLALSLLVLYMAAHWAATFAIAWRIRRGLGWPLYVHLPPVWVALELCRNYLFSGFPWADVGYTQVRTLT